MQKKGIIQVKNNLLWGISNALASISKKDKNDTAEHNILIASTTGIGDTLFGTPALRAIKETFPESNITIMVTPLSHQILINNPYADRFFILSSPINIIKTTKLLYNLIKNNFKTAIIFHASQRIVWPLCKISGAQQIIGESFGTKAGMSRYITQQISNPFRMHTIDRRLSLIRPIGVYTKSKQMDFFLTNSEIRFGELFISSNATSTEQLLIGVHPGAKDPFKCWPPEHFISAMNNLSKKFNCHFFITGSHNELPAINSILENTENSTFVKVSIRESSAIISKLNLFITNDSGPMHIAFSFNIPTIALFSPSDHIRTGPVTPTNNTIVMHKPVTCYPSNHKNITKHQCFETSCTNPDCMRQISPDLVVNAATNMLQKLS